MDNAESDLLPNFTPIGSSTEWLFMDACWNMAEAWNANGAGRHEVGLASVMRSQLKYKRHFAFLDLHSAEVTDSLLGAAICDVRNVAGRQEVWDGGQTMRSEWTSARERVLDELIQSGVRNMTDKNRPALATRADDLFDQVLMHSVYQSYE